MVTAGTVWFESKVDWWFVGLLVAVPALEIFPLLGAIRAGDRDGITAAVTGTVIVAAIYALLVIPVRYGVSSDSLLVHFGVVRQRIRYDAIREVYPSHSLLSSPALSLDRLAIRTGRGPFKLTLISPVDRDRFIEMLLAKTDLVWDGRGWISPYPDESFR